MNHVSTDRATSAPRTSECISLSPTFSEHFKLNKNQADLDFVDVPLETDVPLYLDPYSFKISNDAWYIHCHNLVVGFFQKLVGTIQDEDDRTALRLLGSLNEPNEARLGLSKGKSQGRGLGKLKAQQLLLQFKNSNAVKSGKLSDLDDCELMIPGISNDIISDIAINLVRGMLIDFTQQQCRLHNVPMRRVAAGNVWHEGDIEWRGMYAELPIYGHEQILLIPKQCVRYRVAADHQEYYRHFVLEFLKQEHLDSNTSLVRTIQGGKRKGERYVQKNDVSERNPCSKEYLFEFSEDHPEVLRNYKNFLAQKSTQLSDIQIAELIAQSLERPSDSVFINIQTQELNMNDNSSTVNGDNIAGAVGNNSSVAFRDITYFKNVLSQATRLSDEEKSVLLEARGKIEETIEGDSEVKYIIHKLDELTEQLDAQSRNPGMIRKAFERIKTATPVIGSILSSIKVISDLMK